MIRSRALLLLLLMTLMAVTAPCRAAGRPAVLAELDSLWAAGLREESLGRGELALQQSRAEEDSAALSLLLIQQGARRLSMGQAPLAEPLLREGLHLARSEGDSLLACKARRWLSLAVGLLGEREEARRLYDELLDCADRLGEPALQGWAHVGMGWDAAQRGDFPRSQEHYEDAVRLFQRAGRIDGEVWALNGVTLARRNQGDLEGARLGYRRVVELARSHHVPMVEGIALNNLANLEWTVGDPGRAMREFAEAAAFHLQRGQYREAIFPRINLAQCLAEMGDSAAARDTLLSCLEASRQMRAPDLEAIALESLGQLSLRKERWEDAASLFRRALRLSEGLQFEAARNSMLGLSESLAGRDSSMAALRVLDAGRQWCRQSVEDVFCARLELAVGRRRLELGDPAGALEDLRRADTIAASSGVQALRLAVLTSTAEALRRQGRRDEAHRVLERAVKVWQAERGLPADPDWRALRGAQGRRLFTELARSWLERPGGETTAFDLLQRYKGHSLLERMQGPLVASPDSLDSRKIDSASLQSKVLREGELFIDAYLGPSVSVVFAVDRDRCRAWLLPAEGELRPRLTRLIEELSQPQGGLSPDDFAPISRAVAHELFGPIEDDLPKHARVFFSPDGILNLLPPALFETPGGPRWSRISSAGLLASLRMEGERGEDAARGVDAEATAGHAILLVSTEGGLGGLRLPGAEREMRWLSRRFQGVCRVEGFEEDPGGQILHVAAHTIADDRRPWRSRIILGPARSVSARELMQQHSGTGLAVLAGCASGAGMTLSGEGVQSLSTALMVGGTRTVVATLWAVQDEATFDFMRRFYEELAGGASAGEAIYRTRQRFRVDGEWRHPFYWAAFVLDGDPDSRVVLRRRPLLARPGVWAAVLALLMVPLVARSLRSRP